MRKSSTPDKKRRDKINLFEINNVDYLVDRNAILIEDIDDQNNENVLVDNNLFSEEVKIGDDQFKPSSLGKNNFIVRSLHNYKES